MAEVEEEHREVEKAVVVAREEVAAVVVAKVVVVAAATKAAAAAAKDKATAVDGQAPPPTLQVEAGRTQGNPSSELDLAPLGLKPRNGAGRRKDAPSGREKDG